MKRTLFLTFGLLSLLAACNFNNANENKNENEINDNKQQNIKTTDYKNIKADQIHPEIEEGYSQISYVLIDNESFISEDDSKSYLYKLSCKNKSDSFSNHRFQYDKDGCYYAELSENQQNLMPDDFLVLKNSNHLGSSVEIVVDEIYECFTFTELYYSEVEEIIKVVNYDHVIPGLDESKVNALKGVQVDKTPYVDSTGIKAGIDGNFPFDTGLEITYIDVSNKILKFSD